MPVRRLDDLCGIQRRPVGCRPAVADVQEPLRHRGAQVGQLAGEDNPALVDDDDVLAEVLDQVELVAREQHRRARARDLCEEVAHVFDRDRIEPGERFVEHEEVWFVHQRRDQLDPLLVSVRERIEAVAGPVREAEALEPSVDAAARVSVGRSAEPAEVHELLVYAHAGVQAALLGHVAEPRPLRAADGRTAPTNCAGIQLDQPEHRPHRRRLPSAVRPQKAREPTGLGREEQESSAARRPKFLVAASNSSM